MLNIDLFRSMQVISQNLPHDSPIREKHYEEMDRVWELLTKEEQNLIDEESFAWARSKGII